LGSGDHAAAVASRVPGSRRTRIHGAVVHRLRVRKHNDHFFGALVRRHLLWSEAQALRASIARRRSNNRATHKRPDSDGFSPWRSCAAKPRRHRGHSPVWSRARDRSNWPFKNSSRLAKPIHIQWFFWIEARRELASYCSTESTVTDFGASLRASLPS
jgi:hypothetical protein